MPKPKRSPEEIESVREDIMKQALDLIIQNGYDGFSMPKLGARLGVAAKTIYNYFHNQDELYLGLLTKGFEQLHSELSQAMDKFDDPRDRLRALVGAYVNFGFENQNIYNLMFTWHVPKANDYIGTPMEPTAQNELESALKCGELFWDVISECLGNPPDAENVLREEFIPIWSYMHGYVAGINNTLLTYVHEAPLSLKKAVVDRIARHAQSDLAALRKRLQLKKIP